VADLDSKDNGIFAVDELLSDGESEGTLPDLLPPLSEDDEDWFSEIGDDATLSDDSDWVLGDIAAEVNEGHQQHGPVIKLYNSGSTRHISPYRELFETLTDIPPKPFKAANQQSFNATGVGEMIIEVPNGADASQLRLTEVLFSPEVGYTLVSIGRLDEIGYSATFTDGKCILRNPEEDIIGEIPKSNRGLYRVIHLPGSDSANAAETITVMELHRHMGHIAPSAARRLAEEGLVSGLKFDLSKDEPTFCESCVYAKATRKPIMKVRQGERATEFAQEVHTDLWGPAPVPTIGG